MLSIYQAAFKYSPEDEETHHYVRITDDEGSRVYVDGKLDKTLPPDHVGELSFYTRDQLRMV